MKSGLHLRAHAKINLRLEVVGVQPDGYHLLRTVFQALALHDDLAFERRPGPFELTCDDPCVPADERNLVWKAAVLVWEAAGRSGRPDGVGVSLTKRIPAQGGLGGGSSDGATALVALDALWETGLGEKRLLRLAQRLGADVPFFLCGGTALGLGRGDEIQPMDDEPPHDVVLVFPPFGVSTPQAFRWYDEDLDAGRTAADAHFVNALEGPVSRRHPEIREACRALEGAGAVSAAMTGSGSTVFGLLRPGKAEAAAGRLLSAGWKALATTTAGRAATRPDLEPTGRTRIH